MILFYILSIVLALIENAVTRLLACLFTLGMALAIAIYDYAYISTVRMKLVLYQVLLIESIFIFIAVILFLFQIPECFFPRNPFLKTHSLSYIILVFCILNLLLEVQNTMTMAIKLNEGSLSQEE